MNYWTQSKDNVYVAAHRGWCEKYPENTMAAFKAAAQLRVDQIETDVRLTKDGELVLIHDATVDRTTNGSGRVIDLTLAELKALDAGIKKGESFKGEQIPTFKEFLEYCRTLDWMTLDIELKIYPEELGTELAFETADRILEITDRYGFTDRCFINTFSGKVHDYIRKKYGDKYKQHVYFPMTHLGKCEIYPYSYAYCCCMFSAWGEKMATVYDFNRMESMGVQPMAGASVCNEETVDMALERGATLITCNNPDVILDILRKKGKHK